jgi:hypothetical protein
MRDGKAHTMRLVSIVISSAAVPLALLGGSLMAAAGLAFLALLLVLRR